jgi:plasmid stabilization system protein ParE
MGKVIKELPIVWDSKEFHNFISILNAIKQDSPLNAKRVKTRITNIVKSIPKHPFKFREDEFKDPNDGSYRVFNQDNIRVSYRVTKSTIKILRVRHSKQEPINY